MLNSEQAADHFSSTTALADRLAQLREEYQAGRSQMEALELRQQKLRDTMLRISGAIQVLEELVAQPSGVPTPESHVNGREVALAGGQPGTS